MASPEPPLTYIGESGVHFLRDDPKAVLGRGGFATVYSGWMNEKKVAIKEILSDNTLANEIVLQSRLNHENVLKILEVEEDKDKNFRYIVLELCAGTLKDFIKKEYTGPMPSDTQVMYQIACGVAYIHSQKLIHRNIIPENILISLTSPVIMKISDFGIIKRTSSGEGTHNWMAPEILSLNSEELKRDTGLVTPQKDVRILPPYAVRFYEFMCSILGKGVRNSSVSAVKLPSVTHHSEHGSVASDIFALGCVFFYFIARGIHPFGEDKLIPVNILRNDPVNLTKLPKDQFAYGLVQNMISKVEKRTSLIEVIEILEKQFKFQFHSIERSASQIGVCGTCGSRFHPTEAVLAAYGLFTSSVIILKAPNGSIPFSNWSIEQEFTSTSLKTHGAGISALEWSVNGTQLAAGCVDGTVIVWSYPSGRVLFEMKKHLEAVGLIVWNPFRQDVFATRSKMIPTEMGGMPYYFDRGYELLLWDTGENRDVDKVNHFHSLKALDWLSELDEEFVSVTWISSHQIAIGLWKKRTIMINELDDDKGTSRIVKQFRHSKHQGGLFCHLTDLKWNERTKFLASSSWDTRIKIWSMDSNQPVYTLQAHSDCRRFAWRPNVKTDNEGGIAAARKDKENFTLACGLNDGSVVIWNPLEKYKTNRKRILSPKLSTGVESLSFSPDGRFLASTDFQNELFIWSTQTWEAVLTMKMDFGFLLSFIIDYNLSWMSTGSSSFLASKLTFPFRDKIQVIEQILME